MSKNPHLREYTLRLNGIEYPKVHLRLSIEDGFPGGTREIVIDDPILGEFVVTNDFLIELRHGTSQWFRVDYHELLTRVQRAVA